MVFKDAVTAMDRTTEPIAGRVPVVAIVCSSGGRHAAGRVLSGLPATFARAVIVLQHVSPDHRSMLPEILARPTELPVAAACDGQPRYLALACGADVIAVVLSGEGSDGATGATAAHRFGGTVIVTDEASTPHFSMPRLYHPG
ncbi:chemotaxis protein CheB [Nonomuraea sp. NPDC048826]|uniref:chemotaxis protein CheB n=1 Tax=Nonomuraea sp. NPDC048826 TaxID=3364347 RepID=UPI00371A81BD